MTPLASAILFTVCAFCAVAAVYAGLQARAARDASQELLQSRGRLIAVERTVVKLDDGYRKIWGAVSRLKARNRGEARPPPPDDDDGELGDGDDQVDAFADDGDMDPQLAAMLRLAKRS
jgi:hypothetical protein